MLKYHLVFLDSKQAVMCLTCVRSTLRMNYSAVNCEFNINESTTYFVSLNWNTLKKKTIHWLVDKNAVTRGCGHRASVFPLKAMAQYLLIQCSGHFIEYNYPNTKNQIRIYWKHITISIGILGFPSGSVVKNPPANTGDVGSIPGQEDPLEKEMVTHSSSLAWKNPMDRGAWLAIVHGVAWGRVWLSD